MGSLQAVTWDLTPEPTLDFEKHVFLVFSENEVGLLYTGWISQNDLR